MTEGEVWAMLDVLLVEDDEDVRECIASWLEDAGHRVTQASDGGQAASLLESRAFDVAICDVHLPIVDGLKLARQARNVAPGTSVVMMSSHASVADVARSFQDGALDFMVKPFDPDRLFEKVITPLAARRALTKQLAAAHEAWKDGAAGARVVSASPQMKAVVGRLKVVAQSDSPVLLCGEKGTGKKTLARLVHEESPRRLGPFVTVPCASLAERVVESELRALSGAEDRDAWFRQAEGGTLVLSGIDRIPAGVQATLARALEDPGSSPRREVDRQPRGVRVVATAETDLVSRVASGEFLEALFYRLSAAATEVAPLRERKGDLLPLIAGILSSLASGRSVPAAIEPEAYAVLAEYRFPGNVSELAWALKYAFLMADASPIEVSHLPRRITSPGPGGRGDGLPL
jgi:DNA-binding NtrC family response regulator